MANSADPDQLASSQLIWIYTVCNDMAYPGSAGLGLSLWVIPECSLIDKINENEIHC